ncbi:magnesium and cobalt transport protein CorA [Dysgonomonas sp. 520]|uniref:magnesium and cobalt transport protein CorA n=1 Tax=Dysgonomonas sp. 520 TaxID=2302931 RepID=UPI0013D733DD|nr:magnesium and cobalt transport protein CorA [Dysgonomonas sp. 520]NDW09443.1 magnesium and cobalt transport protein CorA [Dysgonomonas sp. 520]
MSKHLVRKSKLGKYKKESLVLGDITYRGSYNIPTSIEHYQYNNQSYTDKKMQGEIKIYDCLLPNTVSWFQITGLTDVDKIKKICKECGIERFDIRNLFAGQRVTKVVSYPNISFLLLSGCYVDNEKNMQTEQIAFILGKDFVISMQESSTSYFNGIVEVLQNPSSQLRMKNADYLLCMLLNCVQGQYVETIYSEIEIMSEVEDILIDKTDQQVNVMASMREGRNNYLTLRRSVSPLREEFANILHNTNGLISSDNMMYFNDFDDKLRAVLNDLEIYNETLRSVLEIYYNDNSQRMNEIIKRLTVVSTIFIPLTFIVGVWGMNFKIMPEVEWKYGYLFAWLVIFAITLISVWLLKKKRWF